MKVVWGEDMAVAANSGTIIVVLVVTDVVVVKEEVTLTL